VLRYGAFRRKSSRGSGGCGGPGPALKKVLGRHGPIDMKSLIAQALQMGMKATTATGPGPPSSSGRLLRILRCSMKAGRRLQEFWLSFTERSLLPQLEHAFLQVHCGCCRSHRRQLRGVHHGQERDRVRHPGLRPRGSVVHRTSRRVEGLYLPGFSAKDAALDIGDSVITETAGIGGFAMALHGDCEIRGGSARTRSDTPGRCTKSPRRRTTPIRSLRLISGVRPQGLTC